MNRWITARCTARYALHCFAYWHWSYLRSWSWRRSWLKKWIETMTWITSKVWEARSRLYRSRFLQPKAYFAACFKLYKICTFLRRCLLVQRSHDLRCLSLQFRRKRPKKDRRRRPFAWSFRWDFLSCFFWLFHLGFQFLHRSTSNVCSVFLIGIFWVVFKAL